MDRLAFALELLVVTDVRFRAQLDGIVIGNGQDVTRQPEGLLFRTEEEAREARAIETCRSLELPEAVLDEVSRCEVRKRERVPHGQGFQVRAIGPDRADVDRLAADGFGLAVEVDAATVADVPELLRLGFERTVAVHAIDHDVDHEDVGRRVVTFLRLEVLDVFEHVFAVTVEDRTAEVTPLGAEVSRPAWVAPVRVPGNE